MLEEGTKLSVKEVHAVTVRAGDERRKAGEATVKIVWKGQRIAKVIFACGKTVEFDVA